MSKTFSQVGPLLVLGAVLLPSLAGCAETKSNQARPVCPNDPVQVRDKPEEHIQSIVKPRSSVVPEKGRIGKLVKVIIGTLGSGEAQATGGCRNGNYIYGYQISAGVNAGDTWLCCVPPSELLRESFGCGVSLDIVSYGTASDRKVQTCLLVVTKETPPDEYTPACIPAPRTAPGTSDNPPCNIDADCNNGWAGTCAQNRCKCGDKVCDIGQRCEAYNLCR